VLKDGPDEAEVTFERAADILGEADDSVLELDEKKLREIRDPDSNALTAFTAAM
jgi:hypothetical protein